MSTDLINHFVSDHKSLSNLGSLSIGRLFSVVFADQMRQFGCSITSYSPQSMGPKGAKGIPMQLKYYHQQPIIVTKLNDNNHLGKGNEKIQKLQHSVYLCLANSILYRSSSQGNLLCYCNRGDFRTGPNKVKLIYKDILVYPTGLGRKNYKTFALYLGYGYRLTDPWTWLRVTPVPGCWTQFSGCAARWS